MVPQTALQKSYKSALNRLSPDNLQTIAGELADLSLSPLFTEDPTATHQLALAVFEKARLEHLYTKTYAQLVVHIRPAFPDLRAQILRVCQAEFTKVREEYVNELDEKGDRQFRGLVVLIGEMVNAGFLPTSRGVQCLKILSQFPTNERILFYLYTLFSICGGTIIQNTDPQDLIFFEDTIKKIVEKDSGSPTRCRFLFMEILNVDWFLQMSQLCAQEREIKQRVPVMKKMEKGARGAAADRPSPAEVNAARDQLLSLIHKPQSAQACIQNLKSKYPSIAFLLSALLDYYMMNKEVKWVHLPAMFNYSYMNGTITSQELEMAFKGAILETLPRIVEDSPVLCTYFGKLVGLGVGMGFLQGNFVYNIEKSSFDEKKKIQVIDSINAELNFMAYENTEVLDFMQQLREKYVTQTLNNGGKKNEGKKGDVVNQEIQQNPPKYQPRNTQNNTFKPRTTTPEPQQNIISQPEPQPSPPQPEPEQDLPPMLQNQTSIHISSPKQNSVYTIYNIGDFFDAPTIDKHLKLAGCANFLLSKVGISHYKVTLNYNPESLKIFRNPEITINGHTFKVVPYSSDQVVLTLTGIPDNWFNQEAEMLIKTLAPLGNILHIDRKPLFYTKKGVKSGDERTVQVTFGALKQVPHIIKYKNLQFRTQEKPLCENCALGNHFPSTCKKEKICKKCGAAHFTENDRCIKELICIYCLRHFLPQDGKHVWATCTKRPGLLVFDAERAIFLERK